MIQVPGIMAFQALAARTGTVIAGERTRVTIRTALEGDELDTDLQDPATTVVIYKGGRRLPEPGRRGRRRRRAARQAVAGELIGMPGERIGPLGELAAGGPASYLATVIVPAAPTGHEWRRVISFVGAGPGAAGPDHACEAPGVWPPPRW